ncbi:hypothetical protein TJA_23740 [Thermus sp. LT1-2-5]
MYVAKSPEVPGLATEGGTLEEPWAKLAGMVPELLEVNGVRVELPTELHIEANRAVACP